MWPKRKKKAKAKKGSYQSPSNIVALVLEEDYSNHDQSVFFKLIKSETEAVHRKTDRRRMTNILHSNIK